MDIQKSLNISTRYTPDQCKAQQMCDKFVRKRFKTQGMCNEVVN